MPKMHHPTETGNCWQDPLPPAAETEPQVKGVLEDCTQLCSSEDSTKGQKSRFRLATFKNMIIPR